MRSFRPSRGKYAVGDSKERLEKVNVNIRSSQHLKFDHIKHFHHYHVSNHILMFSGNCL